MAYLGVGVVIVGLVAMTVLAIAGVVIAAVLALRELVGWATGRAIRRGSTPLDIAPALAREARRDRP